MERIKAKIGQAGLALAAMGVISTLLYFFDYNVRLLKWIDLWGDTMGWIIRIGLIIAGGALFMFLGKEEEEQTTHQ